jgi:hypothetical protein
MPVCKDCDYPYSTSRKCPNCGSTNPTGQATFIGIAFVLILVAFMCNMREGDKKAVAAKSSQPKETIDIQNDAGNANNASEKRQTIQPVEQDMPVIENTTDAAAEPSYSDTPIYHTEAVETAPYSDTPTHY